MSKSYILNGLYKSRLSFCPFIRWRAVVLQMKWREIRLKSRVWKKEKKSGRAPAIRLIKDCRIIEITLSIAPVTLSHRNYIIESFIISLWLSSFLSLTRDERPGDQVNLFQSFPQIPFGFIARITFVLNSFFFIFFYRRLLIILHRHMVEHKRSISKRR